MSKPNPSSIRQICLSGFLAGASRADIAAEIKAVHPNSAAAEKSAKHIAWHFGDMKKKGLLKDAPTPAKAEPVKTATKPVAAKRQSPTPAAPEMSDIERQAAEMAARIDAELAAQASV